MHPIATGPAVALCTVADRCPFRFTRGADRSCEDLIGSRRPTIVAETNMNEFQPTINTDVLALKLA